MSAHPLCKFCQTQKCLQAKKGCPLAVAELLSLRVRAFPTFPTFPPLLVLPVLPVLPVLAASAPRPRPGLGQPGRRPLLEAFPPEPPVACAPQPSFQIFQDCFLVAG